MGRQEGTRYFVPGLPTGVTDQELLTHFSRYGQVIEAVVAKEKGSEMSRGFGYVTMVESGSRDSLLNDTHVLGGKGIRILLTKESLAGANVKKVHLNDCADISREDIHNAFAVFGQVLDVHTPKDVTTGERKRFAFVTYGTDEAFGKAVEAGSLVVGSVRITIKPAAQTREGKGDWSPGALPMHCMGKGWPESMWDWPWCDGKGKKQLPGRADFWEADGTIRYFVSGIPEQATNEDLFQHFLQYGKVLDAMITQKGGTSRFGYIKMADDSTRNSMLADTHQLCGRTVTVLLSKESLIGSGLKKAHIDNCAEISAEALRDAFTRFGPVLDVHTPKDHQTGERRRFGFITFGTDEALQAAISVGTITVESNEIPIRAATQNSDKGKSDPWAWCPWGKGDWSSRGPYGCVGKGEVWIPPGYGPWSKGCNDWSMWMGKGTGWIDVGKGKESWSKDAWGGNARQFSDWGKGCDTLWSGCGKGCGKDLENWCGLDGAWENSLCACGSDGRVDFSGFGGVCGLGCGLGCGRGCGCGGCGACCGGPMGCPQMGCEAWSSG